MLEWVRVGRTKRSFTRGPVAPFGDELGRGYFRRYKSRSSRWQWLRTYVPGRERGSRQLLADGFIAKLDKRLQELWVIKLKAKLTIL